MEEEIWVWLLALGAGGVAAATSRRVMKGLAIGYVRLTESVGSVVLPVRDRWRIAVAQARQERRQQAAQAGDSPRRAGRRQQQGQQVLQRSAGAAGEAGVDAAASSG